MHQTRSLFAQTAANAGPRARVSALFSLWRAPQCLCPDHCRSFASIDGKSPALNGNTSNPEKKETKEAKEGHINAETGIAEKKGEDTPPAAENDGNKEMRKRPETSTDNEAEGPSPPRRITTPGVDPSVIFGALFDPSGRFGRGAAAAVRIADPKTAQRKSAKPKTDSVGLIDAICTEVGYYDGKRKLQSNVLAAEDLQSYEIPFELDPDLKKAIVDTCVTLSRAKFSLPVEIDFNEADIFPLVEGLGKLAARELRGDFFVIDRHDMRTVQEALCALNAATPGSIDDYKSTYPFRDIMPSAKSVEVVSDSFIDRMEHDVSIANIFFDFFNRHFTTVDRPRVFAFEDLFCRHQPLQNWALIFHRLVRAWNVEHPDCPVIVLTQKRKQDLSERAEEFDESDVIHIGFDEKSAPSQLSSMFGCDGEIVFSIAGEVAKTPILGRQISDANIVQTKRTNYKLLLERMKRNDMNFNLPPSMPAKFDRLEALGHPNFGSLANLTRMCLQLTANAEKGKVGVRHLERVLSSVSAEDDYGNRGSVDSLDLDEYEKKFSDCVIRAFDLRVGFGDIGSLAKAKQTLKEIISWPLKYPSLFRQGVLSESFSGALLFGPPGTGKTMLAKAVSSESGANFLNINMSNIFEKYVGEGEKNVRAIFSLAQKLQPCVIFIDEIDALFETRSNKLGSSSRLEIVTEFMTRWDGLTTCKDHRITVLGATNRPHSLDNAVLRRLPRRLLIDLPNAEERAEILRLILKSDELDATVDFKKIAERTENFAGSDLKSLCMAAALNALRRLISPSTTSDTAPPKVVLSMDDFLDGLLETGASISKDSGSLVELREWNRKFGGSHLQSPSTGLVGF